LINESLGRPYRHYIDPIPGVEGPTCGILPVGSSVAAIYTKGLMWDLNGDKLSLGGLVSTSNRVCEVDIPTNIPTDIPTDIPTNIPTDIPTNIPTNIPTDIPTNIPTEIPLNMPTNIPTYIPTDIPTNIPLNIPTNIPVGCGGAGGPSEKQAKSGVFVDTSDDVLFNWVLDN
jgi:hypothetical protein